MPGRNPARARTLPSTFVRSGLMRSILCALQVPGQEFEQANAGVPPLTSHTSGRDPPNMRLGAGRWRRQISCR